MKTATLRKIFLQYFHQLGHEIVPSSALVPDHDPTLLFTNAGMVQFKNTFLGLEKRPYQRAVSIQRCLRAGGKHNDLENVGFTARHHTFFEMLGFFSFGDYFKREAIHYAWDFLTKQLNIPVERLWVTVYESDDETADIWIHDIGVPATRLSRCGEKDNFWSMGETGPCGPCTEIFYDHGPSVTGGPPGSPEADGDRYIEIWNLVFMQYNRDVLGQLHPLPCPAVDTGMGLERIAAVVQGVHSNYDIDEFQALMHAVVLLAPAASMQSPSVKVIADHLRAVAFLVLDGVRPLNEGRGYVLRRIIRRACRHAYQLGIKSPFFKALLPVLATQMRAHYPDLFDKQQMIAEVLTQEENQFSSTLAQGLQLFQQALTSQDSDALFSGEVAFKLYDTYGFPLDLTDDLLREKGMRVDQAAFERCMNAQRAHSKMHHKFKAAPTLQLDTALMQSEFCGETTSLIEQPIASILVDGIVVNQLEALQPAIIILEKTPFYAESGGQVGDKGLLQKGEAIFEVTDTTRQGDLTLHHGVMRIGHLKVRDTVKAAIDEAHRVAITLNHTATHLLQAALRQILGPEVEQKGSLVSDLRARFDFSCAKGLTTQQLQQVEALVNEKIRDNIDVSAEWMSLEAARKSGAMALFGEKYAAEVRVLSIGSFSKELCGGTHVKRTGDIGCVKLVAEYGIANQVRRIEIVTGQAALTWINEQLTQLEDLAAMLKTPRESLKDKVLQLFSDIKNGEKQLSQMRLKVLQHTSEELLARLEILKNIPCLIAAVEDVDGQSLRVLLDILRQKQEQAIVILYTISQDRLQLVVSVEKSLLGRVPTAPILAKALCDKVGGRDELAQGGGSVPTDLDRRLKTIRQLIEQDGSPSS